MILKYKHLEDKVLLTDTDVAAKKEKVMTLELIDYLFEVNRRKAFAIKGYSSLFRYVVEELKYSESQASERVNAIQLLQTNPEIKSLIEDNKLSLTTASQIQRFVKVEKKMGSSLSQTVTSELVEKCSGQSKRNVEKILMTQASQPAQYAMKETTRLLTEDRVELKFSVGESTQRKLERAKELLGSKTLEQLFDEALAVLIAAKEAAMGKVSGKMKKNTANDHAGKAENNNKDLPKSDSTLPGTQPKKSDNPKGQTYVRIDSGSRYVPVQIKRELFQRSQGQCEYQSEEGHRCNSRFKLQVDHIKPFALGGEMKITNLRHLCPNHNARVAREAGLWRYAK